MIELFKVLFLRTPRRAASNTMRTGYRVQLWKSERGQCGCQEEVIYINVPGTRE